ncbi:hypothetical protein [Sulfuricystis multivorans]|uniref:hypothetical protein n=1 Tax=Sulfuricystis multivorans TaxID=2211108 RepID=UPI000F82D73B|nr:hypothetical protein [Sulfuricystis multivorans]
MSNESTKRGYLPQDVYNDLLRYGIEVEAEAIECITQASQVVFLECASPPAIPVREVAYG